MLTTNGSGQQGLSAHAIRSSQPASSAARSVSRTVVSSTSLASTSASFTRARACNPASVPLAGAKVADLQQVRDLVQRETQPLCCLGHPQHRDCGGRIHAVTTERLIRLMQQTPPLVITFSKKFDHRCSDRHIKFSAVAS